MPNPYLLRGFRRGRLTWLSAFGHRTALVLLLVFAHAAFAQEQGGLLWTAVAPGKPTLFLVPTMHTLVEDNAQLNRTLEAYMGRASALALELPLRPRSQQDIEMYLKHALYVDDDTLLRHIAPGDESFFKKCAADAGVPFEKFARAKPWFNAFHIYALPTRGAITYAGIDVRLANIAQAQKKPVLYLESPGEQAMELDGIPKENQISMLMYACQILDASSANDTLRTDERGWLLQVQRAWQAGDAMTLGRLADSPIPGQPPELFDVSRYIYRDGTDRFVHGLSQAGLSGTSGPILVAVGFGHFFGAASLPERLKKAGYTVTGPVVDVQSQ